MKHRLLFFLALIAAMAAYFWLMRPTAPPVLASPRDMSRESLDRTQETLRKIQKVADNVQFAAVPLDEAIERIRAATGANIFVDWGSLEIDGVERKIPVTLDLRNVPYAQVLKRTLQISSTKTFFCDYAITDGIIVIASSDLVAREAITRVYDIRDLIESDMAGKKRIMAPSAVGEPSETVMLDLYAESVENLTKAITSTIDPELWKENGGRIGSVLDINGRLVITQSAEAHEAVAQLLQELRHPTGELHLPPATKP